MPNSFDYSIVRVVPRPERGEFVNAGAVLFSRPLRYLGACIDLDTERLLALDPDIDLAEVERQLVAVQFICAGDTRGGEIASLPLAGRFHWLVAPRSTVIQMSPVHTGICNDPQAALNHVLDSMVRRPATR